MATFVEMIWYLQELGLADVLIPFFLVFAVVFAILQKTDILGEKRFNVILALSMGFAVVVPHVLWGTPDPTNPYLVTGVVDVVKVINNSLPEVAVTIIGVLMVLLLLGAFGVKWKASSGGGILVLGSLLVVFYIFATNAGWFHGGVWPWWLWWLADPRTQSLLITLLIFGAVVWFITKEKDDNSNKKSFVEKLNTMFETEDT